MYPISKATRELYEAQEKQVLRITGTDKNGTAVSITDADVKEGGFSIDRYACNSGRIEIGTAIAAEMTVKLDNYDGRFDEIIFEGTELFAEIGIANWSLSNPTVYWMPCGYFTPDEQPRSLSEITLTALDRMVWFDKDVTTIGQVAWTDNNGNEMRDDNGNILYFLPSGKELKLPCTVRELVNQICEDSGIELAESINALPNASYTVQTLPDLQQTVSCRNIIQWCAGIMGTNAWMDWNGKIRFTWYNTASYSTNTANRFSSDIYENDIELTGVIYTASDDTKYLAGNTEYPLDISDNSLLINGNIVSALSNIYYATHGFTYRPFEAKVVNAPWLYPMDRISVIDKNGNGHPSLLTNVNFTLNGTTAISAVCETNVTYSHIAPGSFTAKQSQELERINKINSSALHDAVDNATQIITGANGGFVRFIYDGDVLSEIVIMDTDDIETATQVWRWNKGGLGYSANGYNGNYTLAMTQDGSIVADFITTGVLNADLVKAGILGDTAGKNYWNMVTGDFSLAGTSTIGDKTVDELISNVEATISSVDIEYAQSQSSSIAPEEGWSTTAPSWASGWYIWQRTATTTPNGITYSEPTCISGRDGRESTPGLNQATIYLYQRAATQPAKPSVTTTYTFATGTLSPLPSGWSRGIPSGSNPCWVTSANAISTDTADTIAASEWLNVTKLVENGQEGSGVANITDYYAVSNDTNPPADSAFWTANVPAEWETDGGIQIEDSSGNGMYFTPPAIVIPTNYEKYVWKYQVTEYTDGTTSRTNKFISAAYGDEGVGVMALVEEYYLSDSDVIQTGGTWSQAQPEWENGKYIWTRTHITWTDGEETTTDPILASAINGANSTANDAKETAEEAVDAVDNLDSSLNQRGVFNRLTNNGTIQGIFLEDGDLYVNGSYIRTGVLDATLVEVKNLDASRITTGTLDASRIAAGSIAVTQLTDSAQESIATGSTSRAQYYISTSSTQATGGTWSNTVTAWSTGKYAWTRTATTTTYANGTSKTTTSTAVYDANLTSALSTGNTALANAAVAQNAANAAQSTANGANSQEQTIYASKTVGTSSLSAPTAWVTNTTGNQNVWTTRRPVYSTSYPVLFVATQRQTVGGTVTCTTPVIDQTTTVIDGGNIITGTVTANAIAGGTITSAKLADAVNQSIADAQSTANEAVTDASNALSVANSANSSEQIIYRSASSGTTTMAKPTAWVTRNSNTQNQWTTTRPVYSTNYPVLFIATQRRTVGGTVSCTDPVIDQTTTVIDGGHITTGSIDASRITTGTLDASRIAAGSLAIDKLTNDAQSAITTSTSVKNQYYLSTSASSLAGGSWSDTVPEWEYNKYLWTRLAATKKDAKDNSTTSYSTAVYDANMTSALSMAYTANETADNGLLSTRSIFYRSTTDTLPSVTATTTIGTASNTSNAWEYVMPVPKNGCYFFTCDRYIHSNGDITFSPVVRLPNATYTSLWCSASDSTYIDGGKIYANSVTADQLAANSITSAKIATGAITADMITSGTMEADRIHGGTLTLGGSNNTNGTLILKNAGNNTAVELNKSGIMINDGEINIGSTRYGFRVGPYGDVAIGQAPDSMSSIENNYCPFQINSWGQVKAREIRLYGPSYADAPFTKWGAIGASYQYGFYVAIPDGSFNIISDTVSGYRNYLSVNNSTGITAWEHLGCTSGFDANTITTETLIVSGTKNRVVRTEDFGDVLLSAYETPTPMFGDIGEGTIGKDGLCYVTIDPVFAQTISTNIYQVFLQKYGEGDVYVLDRKNDYFIVKGTAGLRFGWEIKGKQRDFDQLRLEKPTEEIKDNDSFIYDIHTDTDYARESANYIKQIQEGRIA